MEPIHFIAIALVTLPAQVFGMAILTGHTRWQGAYDEDTEQPTTERANELTNSRSRRI